MTKSSFPSGDEEDVKDVYLSGNTTQLIKFIAERSSGSQLSYVENIDSKYDLPHYPVSNFKNLKVSLPTQRKTPILYKVPKWHTIRIFISSTFKDMHSERDMLIRYVMPELRKRAASVFVKIHEIDLRWGITETDCASKRAAELCLLEAQKSDLFIGLLGERYGTIYDFDPPDPPELQWVKEYPPGLSITELEMHAGALRDNDKRKQKRAYFYFRNNSFFSSIQEKWKSYFSSENPESEEKIKSLKSKILSTGLKVLDGYLCSFAGILNNKPILSGLETFGKEVLSDLWHAVLTMHEKDAFMDEITEEEAYQQHLLETEFYIQGKNSPISDVAWFIKNTEGIFLISGSPGCGKTAFLVDLLKNLKNFAVIKIHIGLTSRSTDLNFILKYISNAIAKRFPVSSAFPKLSGDLNNHFPDILQEAVNSSGNSSVVLAIDGLDHLTLEDQSLDWIPLDFPKGLRLICTASDSSRAFQVLENRKRNGTVVNIRVLSALSQTDRECIVRQYLKLYGKTLDESPFNNQMLLLVTKKDCGVPLYLRIACDYLRRYASFENFMSTLQSLPSTLPALLQEIIIQLENEYSTSLIQTALTLLCITKEGLDDADFRLLLSLVSSQKENIFIFEDVVDQLLNLNPSNYVSQITYCSLVHTICAFAFGHNRMKKLSLVGSVFEESTKKFYLNKNFSNFAKVMHGNLAAYYYVICDSKRDNSWKGCSASAFRGLLHHLYNGECFQELSTYLCNLSFIEAVFRIGGDDFLLGYYSLLLNEKHRSKSESFKKVDLSLLLSYNSFVSRNIHIFQMYPDLVVQQAVNEPVDSLVKHNIQSGGYSRSSVVECLSQRDYDPRVATLRGFFKNITAAYCDKRSPFAFLGTEDGYLKILDIDSKKVIRSLKSHSSSITFICFAGKNRICTASTDTTLSIWNIIEYSRLLVLNGHKHSVSCCCIDSTSEILLSSSWDNTVQLWSLRDGRSISVIDDFRCPVNCLDHHPLKQQFICGLWNGEIEIWDTVSLKKISVLSTNSGSVKSLVYAPDGINIIASYFNSEVIVWSSEECLKISALKGHILPVKSISYSQEGDILVSGSDDCTLKVWPTESGSLQNTFSNCKVCPISLLQFLSTNYLIVGFQNSDIWVMEMSNGSVLSKLSIEDDRLSCFGKLSATSSVAGHRVDVSLVVGTISGKVMTGNISTCSFSTVIDMSARITGIVFNEQIIVSASVEGDIAVYSNETLVSQVLRGAHKGSVTALNLESRNGTCCVLSSGSDKIIKYWSVDLDDLSLTTKQQSSSKHNDYVTCFCCLPSNEEKNDSEFLTGSHDNNVILHTTDAKKAVFQGLKTSVVNIDITDNCIIGCGIDGSVAIWSKCGKLLSYMAGIEISSAVLCFHNAKSTLNDIDITLAYVNRDGSVKIKKPTQRSYSYTLEGHSKSITSCCTCESGDILSCSLDGTVNMWKLPTDIKTTFTQHSSCITDIRVSNSEKLAVSADAHGNVVLWNVQPSTNNPLAFGAKKTYDGGYVKALSWLKGKKFVCAHFQATERGDDYFLDVISFDSAVSTDNLYRLQVVTTHYLQSEVVCLDASPETETIVAGLKSGEFFVLTSERPKLFNLSKDWILGAKILHVPEDNSEYLFLTQINGSVNRITISDVMKYKTIHQVKLALQEIKFSETWSGPPDAPFISAFCCMNKNIAYCGDSKGWLRKYSTEAPSSKKIHDDAVTGIFVRGSYVFTCSLDRTFKGWTHNFKQVCQFHSPVPITSLAAYTDDNSTLTSHTFLIGNVSGEVHLLKFVDGGC